MEGSGNYVRLKYNMAREKKLEEKQVKLRSCRVESIS